METGVQQKDSLWRTEITRIPVLPNPR